MRSIGQYSFLAARPRGFAFDRMATAGDTQQDANEAKRHDQIRSSVANEGKRQPFIRQGARHYGDIDESLEADQEGKCRPQQ